jgi:hypothetical protein
MRMNWRIMCLGAVAAVFGFLLFMPLLCSQGSNGSVVTSCVTILGLELSGFTGKGRGYPSYWPPALAALVALALVFLAAQFVGRKTKPGEQDRLKS